MSTWPEIDAGELSSLLIYYCEIMAMCGQRLLAYVSRQESSLGSLRPHTQQHYRDWRPGGKGEGEGEGGGGGSLYRVKDNLRNGGEFTAVFRILSRIL